LEESLELFPALKHLKDPSPAMAVIGFATEGRVKEALEVEGRCDEVFLRSLKWKVAVDYRLKGSVPAPPGRGEILPHRRRRYYKALEALLMIQELKVLGSEIGLLQSASMRERAAREGERIMRSVEALSGEDPFLSADSLLGKMMFLKEVSLQRGLNLLREIEDFAKDPYHLPLLSREGGEILLLTDQPEETLRLTAEGVSVAEKHGNHWLAGELLLLSAEAYQQLAEVSRSVEELQRARECFERAGQRRAMALADLQRAHLLVRAGRLKEAGQALKTASKILRKRGDLHDRALLASVHTLYTFRSSSSRRRKKKVLLGAIERFPIKENPRAYNILWEAVEGEGWLREDPETAILFERPEVVTLSKRVAKMIMESARETYPNEFGALLHGYPHVHSLQPIVDASRGSRSFVFSLWDRFSGKALVADGMVHSHPSGVARPSRADLYMFSRFRVNFIIGYPFSEDSMAAYDSVGNRIDFRIVDDD